MICPHCRNTIPNGSNICPLCYAELSGIPIIEDEQPSEAPRQATSRQAGNRSSGNHAYAQGTRSRTRSKARKNQAPTIIAIGIILLLLVVIALIIRSMFGMATPYASPTPTPTAYAYPTNRIYGGADYVEPTPTIDIAVTPTPEPEPEATPEVEYKTLRKGDVSMEVTRLQIALAQLGYLESAQDGIYGTSTVTAVRAFQSANGLDADGIAGKLTQSLLFSMADVPPVVQNTAVPGDILDLPG